MNIFTRWWFWAIIIIALLLGWATCARCSEPAEVHSIVRAHYMSEWQAEGITDLPDDYSSVPYVFQLEDARLWFSKYHGNGTTTYFTLELDGSDNLVRFRKAYIEKKFLGSPAGLRFGIYDNPFGLNTTWDTNRHRPWIGPNDATQRIGFGIPAADLGAGLLLDTRYVNISADIFNGTGYKWIENNEEKDISIRAAFTAGGLECAAGQYKSLAGPTQSEQVWNNFAAIFRSGGFRLTGEYTTSGDIYGELLHYNRDDLKDRDQIFTVAGEYKFNKSVGLAARADKYEDGKKDLQDNSLTELSGGINYYLDGTGEEVLLQIQAQNINYVDGFDMNRLYVQLGWIY